MTARSLSSENTAILAELRAFFGTRSVPVYLVGGFVRDSLLGIPTKDVDLVAEGPVSALARELADTFGGTHVSMGQVHGVERVVLHPRDDSTWAIDLAELRGSIVEDLRQRDFTVDAMAVPLADWGTEGWEDRVIDPLGGKRDLHQGNICAVGPDIFQEDPARLLRAVRLAANLDFTIGPDTSKLMSEQATLISQVPGERVRDEFLAVLSLDGAKVHLEKLDSLGLLCCIIPELSITKGVEQPKEHYWDVFEHSLNTVAGVERVSTRPGSRSVQDPVASVVPWDESTEFRFAERVSDGHTRLTMLKLAGLLHDIAKPQTKMLDENGRTRFLGHHTLGESMSRDILQRLRLSSRGVEMVCSMVEHHLRPTQMSQGGELPTPRAIYRYFRDVGDAAVDTLYLNLGDHLAARGPELDWVGWEHHIRIVDHILTVGTQEQTPEKMPRLVTGHDLIAVLGIEPGPLIGSILESVKIAQVNGQLSTKQAALDWVRENIEPIQMSGRVEQKLA